MGRAKKKAVVHNVKEKKIKTDPSVLVHTWFVLPVFHFTRIIYLSAIVAHFIYSMLVTRWCLFVTTEIWI